jgi:hypothetical protein
MIFFSNYQVQLPINYYANYEIGEMLKVQNKLCGSKESDLA